MTFDNGEADGVCRHCGDEVVWHHGNGGQWLGARPPRDWVTCGGSAAQNAIKHAVTLPHDDASVETLERWLAS